MKKDKINKEIEKLKQQIMELEAGWKRTQADFENFRRRTQDEKINLIKSANRDLILEILPVLDNFNRALNHKPKELENNNYLQGLEYTKFQLEKILTDAGLEKITVKIGDEFNPNLHEAISTEKSDNYKTDQIVGIIEDGYKLGNEILRPVKVKVAK